MSKAPLTLVWSTWGDNTNPMVQASAQGADAFKKLHPNITVQPEPQLQGAFDKILTRMVAGSGAPDLIGGCCATLPSWAAKGLLVKLDPYVARDLTKQLRDDFDPLQYGAFSRPGVGQYALPMYMGTNGLFYNKDRFQAAGVPFPTDSWDWNGWAEAMAKLTDVAKQQWGGILLYNNWQIWLNQDGGHEVDPGNDLRCALDSAESIGAGQWLHDQMFKTNVAIQPGQVPKGESWFQGLVNGRFATAYLGSYQLKQGGKAGGSDAPLLLFNGWDVAQLPKGPKQRANIATIDGWVIWKGSPHVPEAWELMQFLETAGWWDINMPLTTQQPSRKSLQDTWVQVLKKDNPSLQDKNLDAFTQPMKQNYAHPQEFFKYDDQARTVLNGAFTDAVQGAKTDVSTAFKAAAAQINQIEQQLSQGGTISTSSKTSLIPACGCPSAV